MVAEKSGKNKGERNKEASVFTRTMLFFASGQVAFGTLLSRISGLVRDITVATIFGASPATDAFFVAFKIPNFFRRMFAEGAFTQGFIPVLSEYKAQANFAKIRAFISYTAGTLAIFLLLFSLAGVLFSDVILAVIAPGFNSEPEQQALASGMLQITFPYLLLISLTALVAGVLNAYRHFLLPALAPIWLNVCMIIAAIFVAPLLQVPIYALAWAVLVAGALQLVFLLPALHRKGLLVLPRLRPRDSGVVKVVRLMIPAMFGAMVSQINIMIDLLLASFLMAGSISWLYYSDRLMELPLGLFGVTLAIVVLPALSADHIKTNTASFRRTLDWAVRMALLTGAPASAALFILSQPLLSTLFQYGSTTTFDIRMAALSLNAYAIGLLGFMLAKVLSSTFFAQQDVKTPVYVGLITVIVNVLLNLMFIGWLAHVGLALATSIAAILNATLLLYILLQKKHLNFLPGFYLFLVRLMVAVAVMSVALIGLHEMMKDWFTGDVYIRVAGLASLCLSGLALYLAALWLCGFRFSELRVAPASLHQD